MTTIRTNPDRPQRDEAGHDQTLPSQAIAFIILNVVQQSKHLWRILVTDCIHSPCILFYDMATDSSSPRSLRRVLGLFDAIAKAADGLSLAELSLQLDSPKSSLLMLLRQMVELNYLLHENDRYRLGPAIFRLASSILSMRQFPKLIRPYIEELATRTQESVYLALLEPDAKVLTYVEGIESPQDVRYSVANGTTRPLYSTAAGRCLLAYQKQDWIDTYLKTEKLRQITASTMTKPAEILRELEKIRQTKISISVAEVALDAAGIAAPVLDSDGKIAAAILIAAPINRFEREQENFRKAIMEVSNRASGLLGQVP